MKAKYIASPKHYSFLQFTSSYDSVLIMFNYVRVPLVCRPILLSMWPQSALHKSTGAVGCFDSCSAKRPLIVVRQQSPLWCTLLRRSLSNRSKLWSQLSGSWRLAPVQSLAVLPDKGRGKFSRIKRELYSNEKRSRFQWFLFPESINIHTLDLTTILNKEWMYQCHEDY